MRAPRRAVALAILLVLALYLVASIALFRRAPVDGFRDTEDLRSLARESIASATFWRGARPPGYPLLLKAFGPESAGLLRLQLLLHVATWALVAWGVARRCRTGWVRVASFSVLVAGSLGNGLFGWTHAYLTESLSISLLLLPLGLWLAMAPGRERPRWLRLSVAGVAGASLLLWVAMRDLDGAWLVVASIVAAMLAYGRRAPAPIRHAALASVAVAVALAALVSVSVDGGQRWRSPMVNVIGQRVLPVPERRARWQSAGMPDNARVRCFAARWVIDCEKEELSGFEPWLTFHARRTYARELLREPGWLLLEPLAHWKQLLCGGWNEVNDQPLESYFAAKPTGLQKVVARVFLTNWRWLRGELVCALLLVAWAWRRGGLRLDASTAPLLVLAATVYPTMLLAWHGDAMEMQRHALVAMVSLRVAMWGAMALSVDRLWQVQRSARGGAATSAARASARSAGAAR